MSILIETIVLVLGVSAKLSGVKEKCFYNSSSL